MRIGLDARCLNTTHLRGMGKVLVELLNEGLKNTDWTFILFGDEPHLPMHGPHDKRILREFQEIKGYRFRTWEQLALPWMARSRRCDLLHCPSTWCPYWQPVPTVVTLHDTLPWTEDPPTMYLRRIAPAAYMRAREIVTPSDNSRTDVERMWPALEGRVSVIRWGIDGAYLASDLPALSQSLVDRGVQPPYLLYFGGEIPRKRLAWALQVWRGLTARPDLRLVLCGLVSPDKVTPHDRIISLGFVPESDMPALYAAAEAVLYPTLYEGFGFPALESQATGTPVLMSAAGSLQELAGPGAIVLPPDDLTAWMNAATTARQHKQATAHAARAWARGFTWSRVWRQFQDVYERAAKAR